MTTEVKGFKTRTGEKIIISPAPHEHTSDLISDLESTIESKILEEIGDLDFATSNHTHTISLITDLDLSGKADIISNGSEGNFVSIDENGNIKDSGYCSENFASSNHTHSGYADKLHSHSYISDSGLQNAATISTDGTDGSVEILVANGANSKSVTIDKDNIGNLIRAVTNPDSNPDQGSDNLITSGAVYTALENASGLTVDSSITPGGNNAVKGGAIYTALAGKMDNSPTITQWRELGAMTYDDTDSSNRTLKMDGYQGITQDDIVVGMPMLLIQNGSGYKFTYYVASVSTTPFKVTLNKSIQTLFSSGAKVYIL